MMNPARPNDLIAANTSPPPEDFDDHGPAARQF